jgi:hypothetical protein
VYKLQYYLTAQVHNQQLQMTRQKESYKVVDGSLEEPSSKIEDKCPNCNKILNTPTSNNNSNNE